MNGVRQRSSLGIGLFFVAGLFFLSGAGHSQDVIQELLPFHDITAQTEGQVAPTNGVSGPASALKSSQSSEGVREEIQFLSEMLAERREALSQTLLNLESAKSQLARLDAEFESLQQRLDNVGLGLTANFAQLLRKRLERLEQKYIADNLEPVISEQLESARLLQFKLEEFEAIKGGREQVDSRLRRQRSELLTALRQAVDEHIDALNAHYLTITSTRESVDRYQELLRQRLFWLPSAEPLGPGAVSDLATAVAKTADPNRWLQLLSGFPEYLTASMPLTVVLTLVFLVLIKSRPTLKTRLSETAKDVGNVRRDRFGLTAQAIGYSLLLALNSVVFCLLLAGILASGDLFSVALSEGFYNAALLLLLVGGLKQIARVDGVAQTHFGWSLGTLAELRRGITILLAVLLPLVVFSAISRQDGTDELGQLLFLIASLVLAWFVHRLFKSLLARGGKPYQSKAFRAFHVVVVSIPLLLAAFSLSGYHFTAVVMERTLFISACWFAFIILLYYSALRALAIKERRLKLDLRLEQRARERELEATKGAIDASGEAHIFALEESEMDLQNISTQSKTLLKIVVAFLLLIGLWFFWTPVIPAIHFFNEIELWSVGVDEAMTTVTLADLGLAVLVTVVTIFATRNLPGTLEVAVLSQLKLAPGTGYAITTIVNYLIAFFGVFVALNLLGAQWSKLQWLVAALGVGLGFGLQEIVANFVSGIILLFERPIRVGDTVTIGGITGTVARIRIRATTLVDWDRKEQIVPNKAFVTQDLTNWTLSDSITRVIVRVGVAYGSDVDRVQHLLMGIVNENERVVADPAPAVFCVGLGDSSINFEVRVFVRSMLDIMPLSHELHAAITQRFCREGVEIPFPQRDIHIRSEPAANRS